MARLIDVRGIGVVGFPDSMTDGEIASAIDRGLQKAVLRGSPYEYRLSDQFDPRPADSNPMKEWAIEQERDFQHQQRIEERRDIERSVRNEYLAYSACFAGLLLVISSIALAWWLGFRKGRRLPPA